MRPIPIEPPKSIYQRFCEFHVANPDVYIELVRLAHELRAKGHQRVGISLLFAVLRWQTMLSTTDPNSSFKLNNSYASNYARTIMHCEPGLKDFFETRDLRSA